MLTEAKSLKWYLGGPMSGVPQFNIPLFDSAAKALRAQGFTIISPAELDNERVRTACLASPDGVNTAETSDGGTWADFLSRDVKLIADQVDGIILLPNWWRSRGAKLEVFVGLLTGKKFAYFNPKGSWDAASDALHQEDTTTFVFPEQVRAGLVRFMP